MNGAARPPTPDPRLPSALCGAGPAPAPAAPAAADPLRYCVFTTVALLTWLAGPAVVAVMAALGLLAYGRVRKRRHHSRCLLRDVHLVLAYLAAVGSLASFAVVRGLMS